MRMEKPFNMPAMEDVVLGNVAEMGVFGHIDVLFRDHQSDFIRDLTEMIEWESYAKVPDTMGSDGSANMDQRKSVSDSIHASRHGQMGGSRHGGFGSVHGMGSFGSGKKKSERGQSVVTNDPFSLLAQQAAAGAAFAVTSENSRGTGAGSHPFDALAKQASKRMETQGVGVVDALQGLGEGGPVVPLQALGRRPSKVGSSHLLISSSCLLLYYASSSYLSTHHVYITSYLWYTHNTFVCSFIVRCVVC